jgi:hypothetical protein
MHAGHNRPLKGEPKGYLPAFCDLYHGLRVVVGDGDSESIEWAPHSWLDEIDVSAGDWDCDLSAWLKLFRGSLPRTPSECTSSRKIESDLPPGNRVVPFRGSCGVLDGKGFFRRDLLANAWIEDATDDSLPILTFSNRRAALAPCAGAARMYEERRKRYDAAADSLGIPADERVG